MLLAIWKIIERVVVEDSFEDQREEVPRLLQRAVLAQRQRVQRAAQVCCAVKHVERVPVDDAVVLCVFVRAVGLFVPVGAVKPQVFADAVGLSVLEPLAMP